MHGAADHSGLGFIPDMNSFVNERDRYRLNLFPKVASTTFKTRFWNDLAGRHDEFINDPPPFPDDLRHRLGAPGKARVAEHDSSAPVMPLLEQMWREVGGLPEAGR